LVALLKDRYPTLQEEVYSGFYPFDLYLPEHNLVVEVNGPVHFYDRTRIRLPKHHIKERIFKKAGVNYIDLDYYECLNENREVNTEMVFAKIK
jgi:very-short-patch-repair endonuclease